MNHNTDSSNQPRSLLAGNLINSQNFDQFPEQQGIKMDFSLLVLDEEAFESLVSLTDANDASGFVMNLIGLFRGVGDAVVKDLAAALPQREYERIARLAHKLKGSSRNLGLLRLGAVCEILESETFPRKNAPPPTPTDERLKELYKAIVSEFDLAWRTLETRCQQLRSGAELV